MTVEQDAPELEYITPDDGNAASDVDEAETELEAGSDDEFVDGDDQDDAGDDEEGDGSSSEEELEEIEFSGKKYKVHKDLRDGILMHADYTRKTQEVAEARKSLEQNRSAIEQQQAGLAQQAQIMQQNLQGYAQLMTIDQQLEQYGKVDWDRYEREDFMGAQTAFRKFQALRDQRQTVAGNLQRAEHQARQMSQQEAQKQQAEFKRQREDAARETLRVLQKDIKGWDEKLAGEVAGFAVEQGYTREELFNATTDPRAFKLLHKAMQFDRLQAKQKAAAQASKKEQPKPLTQVTRGRTAPAKAGLDDRLSAEEWARRRNEQVRARRA